jgi:phosphatidylglycerophosphatase A
MKKSFSFILATFFGVGNSKIAPGTMGSLATIPLAYYIANNFGIWGISISVFLIFIIGTMATTEVLRHTPHDPGFIVIDEVAGQLITFISISPHLNNHLNDWHIYLVGFILFRIFDIIKPQPVRWADRNIENAWGVMLDDIIAGTYATLILYILFVFGFL